MADRNIPRAEDVFSGRSHGGNVGANLFKKKQAPAPPSGPLPKIGNYQPKSLAAAQPGSPTREQNDFKVEAMVHRPHVVESTPKQYIMGDKNTPLTVTETEHNSQPVAPPRRKRRAPSIPDGGPAGDKMSENPLFGKNISDMSDDDSIDSFEEQGGVIDFGVGSGSRYDRKNDDFSNISTNDTIAPDYDDEVADIDFGIGIDDERAPRRDVRQNGGSDEPYIPPPDYDDEERIFDFDDEGEGTPHVFKEYAGEDYGKYLDDDEDYRLQQRQRPRRSRGGGGGGGRGGGRGGGHLSMGPRPAPRIPGKKYQKKRKGSSSTEAEKRNTIRDFAFNDTKIGWGDRTVKSTSAKGRYIKREKERNRMDPQTHFNRPQSQAAPSYEDFLLGKKDLDSPNSSDSGVDTGEIPAMRGPGTGEANRGFVPHGDVERAASDIFYHSQPKQMRSEAAANNYDPHKASLWKRLTWRFKKSVNISKNGR